MNMAHLVFIAPPLIGHLASTVEMARLVVERDCRFTATILIMKLTFRNTDTPYVESLPTTESSSEDRLRFVVLPRDDSILGRLSKSSIDFFVKFVDYYKPIVREVVTELMGESTRLAGFVVDMLCTSMIDVADELEVPSYAFFASSASYLGLIFHFQKLVDEENQELTELDKPGSELTLPSFVNPVPVEVLPYGLLENVQGLTTDMYLEEARELRRVKGILVNTYSELESYAVESLLRDNRVPPIYPVGPILNLKGTGPTEISIDQSKALISWLDDQPPSSVLFLCFGSKGRLGSDQVSEIARALELSRRRFLWTLRPPPPQKGPTAETPLEDINVATILPKGFLQRTDKIGKVIEWAPQAAVLGHPAVGGFVSHCGWNSTLESIWFGKPVATFPLYAEQQINAFELVRELELAVEIKMDYRMGVSEVVTAETIEKATTNLMNINNDGIRQKVKDMSRKSKFATEKNGSSYNYLGRFIDDVIKNTS